MTLQAIVAELERIDTLLQTDRAEIICDAGDIKMIKTKFRIAGTQESAKSSGNRCIVAYHPKEHIAHILLAYTKTDIPTNHETATWQRLIKENYPRYKHLF